MQAPAGVREELRESHLRSVLKAFSWRIIATLTTGIIAYFVTGDWRAAVTIGGFEFFVKLLVYYLHERAWQLVPRGTVRSIMVAESPARDH